MFHYCFRSGPLLYNNDHMWRSSLVEYTSLVGFLTLCYSWGYEYKVKCSSLWWRSEVLRIKFTGIHKFNEHSLYLALYWWNYIYISMGHLTLEINMYDCTLYSINNQWKSFCKLSRTLNLETRQIYSRDMVVMDWCTSKVLFRLFFIYCSHNAAIIFGTNHIIWLLYSK